MLLAMMVNPFYRDPVPDYFATVLVFIAAIISSLYLARLTELKRITLTWFFLAAVGVVAIAAQCLIPPWRASYDGRWMGYFAWIALPMRHSVSVEVDVARLVVQIVMTGTLFGIGLIFPIVFQRSHVMSPDSTLLSEEVFDPDEQVADDSTEQKRKNIKDELLVNRMNRAVFDPDRFRLISITLMILFGLLFTFFTAGLLLFRLSRAIKY